MGRKKEKKNEKVVYAKKEEVMRHTLTLKSEFWL